MPRWCSGARSSDGSIPKCKLASKQSKQASKASKDGLGESEWGGVVLVAKWVGQGCFIGQGWRGMPWFGMCKARASTWVSLGVEGN